MKFLLTNVFALALAGLGMSSPLLEARGGCDQGQCPDTKWGMDLFAQETVPGDGKWNYKIRWQGKCGCTDVATDASGCADLHICTGHQRVCFDWFNKRADWHSPDGRRTCYSTDSEYVCPSSGMWEAWPVNEVECAW